MGRRLRGFVGALKDKASISKASLTCTSTSATATVNSTTSPDLAVLRVTTHHPSPPHPHHTAAILAFGLGSRLAASALVEALVTRLAATRNATVALKALLAAHHAASRGSFILRDQLSAAIRPTAAGHRRNPLNVAAFRDASSAAAWILSDWVRWYARVLETLLAHVNCHVDSPERVTSLLDKHLIAELAVLVDVVVEVAQSPAAAGVEGNQVVWEAVRLVEEDRLKAEQGIVIRVREVKERLGSLGFADSVELVCLLRRLGECRHCPVDGKWWARIGELFWNEIYDVIKKVGEVGAKEESGRVRRERTGESARIPDRVLLRSTEPVRFGSSRWKPINI